MPQNNVIASPVVLFIYKRPNHTLKVIEKINKVNINKVYIVADGWKNDQDKHEVMKTRDLIEKINSKVVNIFFTKNIGLRKNCEIGLEKVFSLEEKAIILEDDTVPDESFFRFCDELLSKYSEFKQISMIAGSNFKTDITQNYSEDYFFSMYPFFWGWATWKDRWKDLFDNKMTKWIEYKSSKSFQNKFVNKRELNYWKERFNFHQKNPNLGTWDYPFLFSQFYNEKKTIVPKINLIENIGYDIPTSQNPNKTRNLKTFGIIFPLKHPSNHDRDKKYDNF